MGPQRDLSDLRSLLNTTNNGNEWMADVCLPCHSLCQSEEFEEFLKRNEKIRRIRRNVQLKITRVTCQYVNLSMLVEPALYPSTRNTKVWLSLTVWPLTFSHNQLRSNICYLTVIDALMCCDYEKKQNENYALPEGFCLFSYEINHQRNDTSDLNQQSF